MWCAPAIASWLCEGCVTLRHMQCFKRKVLSAPVPGLLAVRLMKLDGNQGRITIKTCTKCTCSHIFSFFPLSLPILSVSPEPFFCPNSFISMAGRIPFNFMKKGCFRLTTRICLRWQLGIIWSRIKAGVRYTEAGCSDIMDWKLSTNTNSDN